MKNRYIKHISLVLALVMLLTMLPVTAMAQELDTAQEPTESGNGQSYTVAVVATDSGRAGGGGPVAAGDETTVIAYPAEGFRFIGWYDESDTGFVNCISTKAAYTFTVGADTSLVAKYEAAEGATFTLTVAGAAFSLNGNPKTESAEGTFGAGEVVFLSYTEDTDSTQEFLYWANEQGKILSTSKEYRFALLADTSVHAVCAEKTDAFHVIFRNAYSQIIGNWICDASATDVKLPATPLKMGSTFQGWYVGDEKVESVDAIAAILAVKEVGATVEILPRYEAATDKYTITVTYNNAAGEVLAVPADWVKEYSGTVGKKTDVSAPKMNNSSFLYWKIGDKIVGYDVVYSVLRAQPGNVVLTAVYGEAVTPEPIVNITQTYGAISGEKYVISNTMQYYLPEESMTLLESGFVYSTSSAVYRDDENKLTLESDKSHRSISSGTGLRGIYTFNGLLSKATTTLYIRGYVSYKDTDGTVKTAYSSVVSGSYNTLLAVVTADENKTTQEATTVVAQPQNADIPASATVPAGTALSSSGAINLTISVKKTETPVTVSEKVTEGNESTNYQVSIAGIDNEGNSDNSPIVVHLKKALPAGLSADSVTAYHQGVAMIRNDSSALTDANTFYYDSTTGDIYIAVTHFSDFTFVYPKVSNTVTLHANGGWFVSAPPTVAVTQDSAMPPLANSAIPSRTGYTFAGYFGAPSDGTKYYSSNGESAQNWDSAATTLYAHWVANSTISVKLPNTDKYLYRVGNQNAVPISKLFTVNDPHETGATLSVSVDTADAVKSISADSITFKNTFTGVVNVTATLTANDVITATKTLPLEVVAANNATSAMSATSNNVVLLDDIQFSTIEVSNGYGLYGNGFKMTSSNDISCSSFNSDNGYVNLTNGTIDNVQIICPYFTKSILYTDQATKDSNNRYQEVRNAVAVSGGSKSVITNCYIKGGRSAVFCGDTHLTVSSTTMEGGALANMLVHGNANIVLDDVSTIQRESVSTINTGKKILGLGIVVENETASISLNNTLTQENWITETQVEKYASAISSFLDFDDSTFAHEKDGVIYLNAGIIWIGNWDVQNIADNLPAKLEDNRAAKNTYSGADKTVSIGGVTKNGGIYTVNNTATTLTAVPAFSPSGHDVYPPVFSFDNEKNAIAYTDDNTPYCEYKNGTITLSTMQPSVTLDVSGITLMRNGEKVEYTLEVSPDADINGDNLTLNTNSPDYTVNITGTVYGFTKDGLVDSARGKEFSWKLPIHITKLAYPAPQWDEVSTTGSNHLWIVDKPDTTDPDYSDAIPIFNGIKVTYYNKAGELVKRDFSSETVAVDGNVATFDDESKLTITYLNNMTGYSYTVAENSDGNNTRYYYKTTYRNNRDSNSWQIKYSFTDPNGRSTENTITVSYSFSGTSPGTYCSKNAFDQGNYESCSGDIAPPCVPAGTLIALADGTQKPVEELTGNEELLVWDFDTASYASAPIVFIEPEPEAPYEIIRACFSDGTEVETTYEHGFFDYSRAKFIYINDDDPEQYIGDLFVMKDGDGWRTVELTSIERETKVTTVYGLTTYHHFNYFNNDMLSIEGNITGMFNYFEVDRDTMGYDQEKKQADIEKYGLLTYEDFEGIIDEFGFMAYNGQYLAVSVGKGLITWDGIKALADYYGHFTEGRVVNTQ